VPAPRHRNALHGVPLPQAPSFNELDVADKPVGIRQRPLLTQAQVAAIQENWQQRRETLVAVDEAVASIIETLRSTGELDETLIVFTTDNGFFHGEHRVPAGKVLWYEPSIHAPLLMRWTGNRSLPRGVHRRQLVMNVDHASTILAAARARPGRRQDGVSLLPLWRDGAKELGRDILIENTPGPNHFDGIRTKNFKYAEYANGERELYDLRRDPYELESQHANPAYDAVEAALAARLRNLVGCAGESCRARPAARFRAVRRARCRVFRASVRGAGIERVRFRINGRRAGTDRRPPFRATLRVGARRANLRAQVEFSFDQVVTLDRFVRRCR
jgi:N-acetylglucosamine-6-sulfatase